MVKGGEKGGKVFVRSRTKVSNVGHFRQVGRKGRKHILSGYIYLHTQGLHFGILWLEGSGEVRAIKVAAPWA